LNARPAPRAIPMFIQSFVALAGFSSGHGH
jgi:hypothetical protein